MEGEGTEGEEEEGKLSLGEEEYNLREEVGETN